MLVTLLDMLTYARPMGSHTERQFRDRYLLNLPGAWVDPYHNIHVQVGVPGRVLWSCHTDTAHRTQGRQRTTVDRSGVIRLAASSLGRSSCLGADDTVGVYLMREMVLAGKAGAYVFHHGEERGCIGAGDLARDRSHWYAGFDMAIALDRAGTHDIVSHQMGQRCASPTFINSLGAELSRVDSRLTYRSAHGVYTDTAEYTHLIPECTNLSVGYEGQHGRSESVNSAHVMRLRNALITLDTDRLIVARNPLDSDYGSLWGDYGYADTAVEVIDGYTYEDDPDDPWADTPLTMEQCRDLYDRYMAEQRAERTPHNTPCNPPTPR